MNTIRVLNSLVLMWVQTVCKSYQQTIKVVAILSSLARKELNISKIWVEAFCKGYQQRTKVAANKERVKLDA